MGRGPGSLPPARETIDAVAIALGTATAKTKGEVSRIKKNKKDTFLLSCKGHLMDLYARLDQEFDKALSEGEGDSEVDNGSEWGPQHKF